MVRLRGPQTPTSQQRPLAAPCAGPVLQPRSKAGLGAAGRAPFGTKRVHAGALQTLIGVLPCARAAVGTERGVIKDPGPPADVSAEPRAGAGAAAAYALTRVGVRVCVYRGAGNRKRAGSRAHAAHTCSRSWAPGLTGAPPRGTRKTRVGACTDHSFTLKTNHRCVQCKLPFTCKIFL